MGRSGQLRFAGIGSANDPGEMKQGRVILQMVPEDKDIKAAEFAVVAVGGTGNVIGLGLQFLCSGDDLMARDIEKDRIRIDETTHQPRTGNTVDLWASAGNPATWCCGWLGLHMAAGVAPAFEAAHQKAALKPRLYRAAAALWLTSRPWTQ